MRDDQAYTYASEMPKTTLPAPGLKTHSTPSRSPRSSNSILTSTLCVLRGLEKPLKFEGYRSAKLPSGEAYSSTSSALADRVPLSPRANPDPNPNTDAKPTAAVRSSTLPRVSGCVVAPTSLAGSTSCRRWCPILGTREGLDRRRLRSFDAASLIVQ